MFRRMSVSLFVNRITRDSYWLVFLHISSDRGVCDCVCVGVVGGLEPGVTWFVVTDASRACATQDWSITRVVSATWRLRDTSRPRLGVPERQVLFSFFHSYHRHSHPMGLVELVPSNFGERGDQVYLVSCTLLTVIFFRWTRPVTSNALQLFISGLVPSGPAGEASGYKGRGMDVERQWVQHQWEQIITRARRDGKRIGKGIDIHSRLWTPPTFQPWLRLRFREICCCVFFSTVLRLHCIECAQSVCRKNSCYSKSASMRQLYFTDAFTAFFSESGFFYNASTTLLKKLVQCTWLSLIHI